MKNSKLLSGVIALGVVFSTSAVAECYCACINNKKTKVCENSWDANYVYCPGTYCTSDLKLPEEYPSDVDDIGNLFAVLSIQSTPQMSTIEPNS